METTEVVDSQPITPAEVSELTFLRKVKTSKDKLKISEGDFTEVAYNTDILNYNALFCVVIYAINDIGYPNISGHFPEPYNNFSPEEYKRNLEHVKSKHVHASQTKSGLSIPENYEKEHHFLTRKANSSDYDIYKKFLKSLEPIAKHSQVFLFGQSWEPLRRNPSDKTIINNQTNNLIAQYGITADLLNIGVRLNQITDLREVGKHHTTHTFYSAKDHKIYHHTNLEAKMLNIK